MNQSIRWMRRAIVYAGLASCAVSQQTVPDQPFQEVHMIAASEADDEKKLTAALDDFNSATAKGCPPCVYHLWKTRGQQSGPFNYLWIANWPDRAIYRKVHATAEYTDATKRHPEIGVIIGGQISNEYVEVKLGN